MIEIRHQRYANRRNNRERADRFVGANTPGRPKNDSQNVHDSAVINASRQEVQRLRKEVGNDKKPDHEALREIRIFLESNNNNEKAIKALDNIESNIHSRVSGVDVGEIESLVLMWSYIDKQKDQILKDNLKDSLKTRLDECINTTWGNNDKTYCSTGKVVRIIDTTTGIDNGSVQKRPLWAIRQMMINRGNSINKEMQDSAPEDVKKILNKRTLPTEEENKIIDTFGSNVKEKIMKELANDYLDTGVLTKQQFDKETMWVDSVV